MSYSTIFGIILLASAGTSFILGIYTVKVINKVDLRRVIVIMCSALAIWSMGLAVTAAAANEKIAMIGYLIAPLGWAPMSALLVHFALTITGKKKVLKKWWLYIVLYGPAVLMIVAFTILPFLGYYTDSFVLTYYGWVPIVEFDIWDLIFRIYYIAYTLLSLIILLETRRKTKDRDLKVKISWITISILITYTIGAIAEIHLVNINHLIPRHGTIFSLIFVGTIACLVNKFPVKSPTGLIGNQDTYKESQGQSNVYKILGYGFLIGSVLNIVNQKLLFYKDMPYTYEFSLFMIVSAILILLTDKLKIKDINKEVLVSIICSVIIPVITLTYIDTASISVWAFVFILLILCVIFNYKILIHSMLVTSTMTQVLCMAVLPRTVVEVTEFFYLIRIFFVALSGFTVIYVNYIYFTRVKENKSFNEKEAIISEITRSFISAKRWDRDEMLYEILKKAGSFVGSERSCVVLFNRRTMKVDYCCEWLEEGITSRLEEFGSVDESIIRSMIRVFDKEQSIEIGDTRKLPTSMLEFKSNLEKEDIKGVINLPIKEKGKTIGIMGFSSSKPLAEWRHNSTEFMYIMANLTSDILHKIKVDEKNEILAYYDQLTHLPTRTIFNTRLEEAIDNAREKGNMVAVVFVDIDSFKSINDTLGHNTGDIFLAEVARILSRNVRDEDTVSRFGGDEFVIILNNISTTDKVIQIMNRLIEAVRKPINIKEREYFVTVSAGVALYPQDGEDYETLTKHADTAMYFAKELGKNRYLLCSEDMKVREEERVELTNKLHRAIEKDQLTLHYQPQVDLETMKIVGLEALLRWSLPGKGMISSEIFIPLAERTGLINSIGEWVLEKACIQGKKWNDMGCRALRIGVNISVYQINNPDFLIKVKDILIRTGLPPTSLELEITENSVGSSAEEAIDMLSILRSLGVTISIDDFGTEYSSLNRLKVLPIDRIKMDMQFVQGIDGTEKDKALTKGIINLAKAMDLRIIAEGVETKSQLDFLMEEGCDEVQGYYFYKPMPSEEVGDVLRRTYGKAIE